MPTPRKLDVKKALQQRLKGASYQSIADSQKVAKSTVILSISPLIKQLPNAAELAEMKASMADHLLATAFTTVAAISTEDIEKASLQQKATSAAILIDKHRLMTGQTTQNQGLAVFFKAVVDSVPRPKQPEESE